MARFAAADRAVSRRDHRVAEIETNMRESAQALGADSPRAAPPRPATKAQPLAAPAVSCYLA